MKKKVKLGIILLNIQTILPLMAGQTRKMQVDGHEGTRTLTDNLQRNILPCVCDILFTQASHDMDQLQYLETLVSWNGEALLTVIRETLNQIN